MKSLFRVLFCFCLLLFLFIFPAIARAHDVTLAWDDDQPGVTYRIEQAAAGPDPAVWTVSGKDIGPKEFTLQNLPPGRYLFRCFAVAGNLESDPSAVLEVTIRPGAPQGLRIKVALRVSRDGMKTWQTLAVHEEEADNAAFFRAEIAAVK